MKELKYIVVPFDNGGYAKLMFTKVEDNWHCIMSDEIMHNLNAYLEGKTPREYVKPYIDGNGLWD